MPQHCERLGISRDGVLKRFEEWAEGGQRTEVVKFLEAKAEGAKGPALFDHEAPSTDPVAMRLSVTATL
jgi:hypothetical protein